jgi:hypothetical protein
MGHIGNFDTLFLVAKNISLSALHYNMRFCQNLDKKEDYLTYKTTNPFRISDAP